MRRRVLIAFFHLFDSFNGWRYAPTGYVWAGVDSACEQDAKRLEATLREMLVNRARAKRSPQRPGRAVLGGIRV